MTHQLLVHGLILLFALVAVESAGVPVPGETALVAAGVLAAGGHYSLITVIAVGAVAAIIGDNVGYWLGRRGGRVLLLRVPFVRHHFERALPPAERFFARHGGKTVLLGRFVAFLRITTAWLAGMTRMPWWRFLLWNAAGGILWAATVAIIAYEFGTAAAKAIERYGIYGAAAVIALVVLVGVGAHLWRKRMAEEL